MDGSPAFNGADFTWTYAAALGPDEGIGFTVPSFFTIYDFVGLDSVISMPTGWSDSVQLTGVTPTTVIPSDNPGIENITFNYAGSPSAGAQPLGDFVITSQDGALNVNGNFAFQTGSGGIGIEGVKRQGSDNVDQGSGIVTVPTSATPEPRLGLFMALGAGLIGLAGRRNVRKKHSQPTAI